MSSGRGAGGTGRHDGVVVVVDGPSHVGKTTTVAALQHAWPAVRTGPLLDGGYEHALASFGEGSLPRWWDLVRSVGGAEGDHLRWGPLGRELIAGMHRAAAAWASAGFDVAVEHVLVDRTTVGDLMHSLDGLTVVHVGLICDPDVLEARELEAAGEAVGRAVTELRATADVATRDLVLDTTEMTTDELVEAILDLVGRRLR